MKIIFQGLTILIAFFFTYALFSAIFEEEPNAKLIQRLCVVSTISIIGAIGTNLKDD